VTSEIAERFANTAADREETGDVEPLVAMFTEDAELSNLAMTEPLQGMMAHVVSGKSIYQYLSISVKFTNVVEVMLPQISGCLMVSINGRIRQNTRV